MGSPALLKTIKLKMKRGRDIGTEGYLSLVKRATFKDLFYFFIMCMCVGLYMQVQVPQRSEAQNLLEWDYRQLGAAQHRTLTN